MNDKANEIQWRKGDIVIHDADAKEPKMLMKVIGYTRDGLCKTQYISRDHKRTVWKNDIQYLHKPEMFKILSCWGDYHQSAFAKLQTNWENVRIWNHRNQVGQKIETTSADGGFQANTGGLAYIDAAGQAMIYLIGHGNWDLNFVEAVSHEQA